jgi:hypothetical protein
MRSQCQRLQAGLRERWAAIAPGGKEAALIELLRSNPHERKLVFVHSRETLSHIGGAPRRSRAELPT